MVWKGAGGGPETEVQLGVALVSIANSCMITDKLTNSGLCVTV